MAGCSEIFICFSNLKYHCVCVCVCVIVRSRCTRDLQCFVYIYIYSEQVYEFSVSVQANRCWLHRTVLRLLSLVTDTTLYRTSAHRRQSKLTQVDVVCQSAAAYSCRSRCAAGSLLSETRTAWETEPTTPLPNGR